MLQLITDILGKSEIKREVESFYQSKRFWMLSTAYYLSICVYIIYQSVRLLGHDAHPFIFTFFVVLIGAIIVRSFLVYKKEILSIYPSFLVYMYYPEHNQKARFLIFSISPIFYILLFRTLRSSTNFISEDYKNAHIVALVLCIIPILFEFFIFVFLIIVFLCADVIASKCVVTEEMEKQFGDDGVDCLICKCEFEKDEILTSLKCHHKFHDDCIVTWFKFNNACPLCKQTLLQQGSLREIVSKYE